MSENTLYYGDNLDILRNREYFPDACVDLIYLDPPFNSNRSYNVLFKDESGKNADAQIKAFEDTWQWGPSANALAEELIMTSTPRVSEAIKALLMIVGRNQMMAYLVMMTARLVELHRVLKPTGSFYLHCDPSASHYLKVILDAIFDPRNFRNEIIWRRTRAHNDRNITRYGAIHDVILFYTKGDKWIYNVQYMTRDENAPKTHDLYTHTDGKLYRKGDCRAPGGRGPKYEWNGYIHNWRFTQEQSKQLEAEGKIVYSKSGMPRVLRPVDPEKGSPLQDIWFDIDTLNSGSKEILNYPTQKPLTLLERIISTSSNPGDVVLDPFCGCGTAVTAAQKLGRHWRGIDITSLSIRLQKTRLKDMFELIPYVDYAVIGEPKDLADARQLAQEDRYDFQNWVLGFIPSAHAIENPTTKKPKKGADGGIDGVIPFKEYDNATGKVTDYQRALVQVKSGGVERKQISELRGTIEREGAALGIFITLEKSKKPMNIEAESAGYYRSEWYGTQVPRIQILTIEQLMKGAQPIVPNQIGVVKAAPREKDESAKNKPQRLPGMPD